MTQGVHGWVSHFYVNEFAVDLCLSLYYQNRFI